MSDFLDTLRDARRSAVAVKHKLRLLYNDNGRTLHAFFESTDDVTFYLHYIKRLISPEHSVETYICDGKTGVQSAYKFAHENNFYRNTLYFADRDLDDFDNTQISNSDDIFLTEFYSIENYLCTDHGFSVIWSELIKLPVTDALYSQSLEHINSGLNGLRQILFPFFAWVIAKRKLGEQVGFSKFGNGLSSVLDVVDLLPIQKEDILIRFKEKSDATKNDPPDQEIELAEQKLSSLHYKCWMRGKFELWYFVLACNEIWKGLVGHPISGAKRVKKNIHLDAENIFNFLSCKITMPHGLDEYILRRTS